MKVSHYIFKGYTRFVGRLPFWILYRFADLTFIFVYYLLRYRRKVTFNNLQNSFPEKDSRQIRKYRRRYYRNISDIFHELVKIPCMSPDSIRNRMRFKNNELVEELFSKNKSVIAIGGHVGNWEWMGAFLAFNFDKTVLGVAKPLSSPFFNDFINQTRGSRGLIIVPFKNTYRIMLKHKNEVTLTYMIGDQTPTRSEIEYWTTFLNQQTPVFLGTEKIATALDSAVVFLDTKRIKRGYYETSFKLVTDSPKELKEFDITEAHVRMLEDTINQQPDNWLWSHRRWKHKRLDK